MQNYDILVFTETCLTPRTTNDDIHIVNFETPYRKDRYDHAGGGVAIYGIKSRQRYGVIIIGDTETLCVETSIQSHKTLLCSFYIGPDYWNFTEGSFDDLSNCAIDDIVILVDFHYDL